MEVCVIRSSATLGAFQFCLIQFSTHVLVILQQPPVQVWCWPLTVDVYIHRHSNFIKVTCATLLNHRSDQCTRTTHPCGFQPLFLPKTLFSLWGRTPHWFPRAKQPLICITVPVCLASSVYIVCVCISLLLFTFSFVENTENHSETPAAPAPPPSTLPKPKPKPKPKKTPVLPKGAAAGASPKGDEVPPIKKNTRAPGKQAPVPPPKPASRNATREAGEYAPRGSSLGVFRFGVGLIASSRNDVWCQDVTPVDSALTRRMPRRFFCWCLY